MNEDRATRYHRLKRRASVVSMAWSAVLLAGLLATGGTLALRRLAEGAGGTVVAIAIYVCLLFLLNEAVSLPLSFYSG